MKIFIETPRLILREVLPSDVDGFFALDSDPEVVKYFKNQLMTEKVQAEKLIEYVRKQYVDNGIGRWAIVEKDTNDFVGWSGLKFVTDTINNQSNFYDIGYRLLHKHWGKGYATETAVATLDYGFNTMQLNEIYSGVHVDNIASNIIITKIGMKNIGKFSYFDAEHNWYKITKAEYQNGRSF